MIELKRIWQHRTWLMIVCLAIAMIPGIAFGFSDGGGLPLDWAGEIGRLSGGLWPLQSGLARPALVGRCPGPNPALPCADAGPDRLEEPGDLVVLDGTASTGDSLQFSWLQIGGPAVTLTGANTATPSFIFPNTELTLTFELTVTDINNISDVDTVDVIALPLVPPPSLKTVPVPEPDNLMDFVKDKDAAIKLGKAFFWDMQAGSDGIQACASCHFHAGTDNRFKNQLSPSGAPPATAATETFEVGGPNYTLTPDDFPFHKLQDPFNRHSAVIRDSDDVASSQGMFAADFIDVISGSAAESCADVQDLVFHVGGTNVRRVEPRNTPSVINAVFNLRNFWDGRANFVFNGVNPFGARDPNARILEVQPGGDVVSTTVRIQKASLASQAVGPPASGFEMACGGRPFAKIGKKMLSLRPLAKQEVHPNDSVLAGIIDPSGKGLGTTYADMIKAAFWEKYWNSDKLVDANLNVVGVGTPASTDEYTVMEANFSLFWGLAIQLYEATLVSDDAPFDRFMEGDATALTEEQKHGFEVFINQGQCIQCHFGAEFTKASVSHILGHPGQAQILELMLMADNEIAIYDNGFYNIGVRPTSDDLGVGGTDPFGNPLSFTRLAQNGVDVGPPFNFTPPINPAARVAVDGAFKVPGLRNVELTGPYFHNGGQGSLRQVIEFYVRGGDFHEQNINNLDPSIQVLPLSDADMAGLEAFLRSLTDDRVRFQKAPFDHPQLFIPNGHPGNETSVTDDGTGKATEHLLEIPAVGAEGGSELKPYFVGSVRVTKTVDKPVVRPDDQVKFTIQVENTGNIDLKNVSVTDPLCTLSGPAGDGADIGVLNIGETWTFTCSLALPESVINTVTVIVDDPFFDPGASNTEASVEVVVDTTGPTNATLQSFTAAASEGDVVVQWETVTEIDNLGFNLWRSGHPDAGFERVNGTLIPSQAAGAIGAAYEFVEHDVPAGTWYYKLETISYAGATDGWHGPISVQVGDGRQWPIYLPLIGH